MKRSTQDALAAINLDPSETETSEKQYKYTSDNVLDGVSKMTEFRESRSRDKNYPVQIGLLINLSADKFYPACEFRQFSNPIILEIPSSTLQPGPAVSLPGFHFVGHERRISSSEAVTTERKL